MRILYVAAGMPIPGSHGGSVHALQLAIGAQIGWMQLGGQFRALRTMRIEPDRVLFAPLFWSLVMTNVLASLAGIVLAYRRG